jgi:hypothetical protein
MCHLHWLVCIDLSDCTKIKLFSFQNVYVDNIVSTSASYVITTSLSAIMGRNVAASFTWSSREALAKELESIHIIKNICN